VYLRHCNFEESKFRVSHHRTVTIPIRCFPEPKITVGHFPTKSQLFRSNSKQIRSNYNLSACFLDRIIQCICGIVTLNPNFVFPTTVLLLFLRCFPEPKITVGHFPTKSQLFRSNSKLIGRFLRTINSNQTS
jgi:hypothetical protein